MIDLRRDVEAFNFPAIAESRCATVPRVPVQVRPAAIPSSPQNQVERRQPKRGRSASASICVNFSAPIITRGSSTPGSGALRLSRPGALRLIDRVASDGRAVRLQSAEDRHAVALPSPSPVNLHPRAFRPADRATHRSCVWGTQSRERESFGKIAEKFLANVVKDLASRTRSAVCAIPKRVRTALSIGHRRVASPEPHAARRQPVALWQSEMPTSDGRSCLLHMGAKV